MKGRRKVRWPRHAACGCYVYTGSWIIMRGGLWLCLECALADARATTTEGEQRPMDDIDARAEAMTDQQRQGYIIGRGWTDTVFGYLPPIDPADIHHASPHGAVVTTPSGIYSLSTAIREQFAREDPDAVPDLTGRYYHGTEPAGATGKRW